MTSHFRFRRLAAPVLLAALFAAGPVAATAAAAAPAATPAAAPAAAVGSELPFADLPNHVGARIRVTTKYGTVREGELAGASSIAINLKLDPDQRGIVLGMPADSIVKVELVAPAAAAH